MVPIRGEGGAAARLAVSDFIALSPDAETAAVAKAIGPILFDDLNFEKEFALIPRDTYATIPNAVLLGFSAIALATKREVTYKYEDLAPHVKRIVERERVKAEIDAANRIQAALLPLDTPNLAGASV